MRARGAPRARRVGPLLFWVFDGLFVSQRVTGTLGRTASRAFCLGRGHFTCPLRPFFTLHVFFVPPQVFFFRELLRELPAELRDDSDPALYGIRVVIVCVCEGGNAVRFFRGRVFGVCPFLFREFLWKLFAKGGFGKKNLVFPGISWFFVFETYGFCYCFALS